MNQTNQGNDELVLLVHGTFSSVEDEEPPKPVSAQNKFQQYAAERWWQRGSRFSQSLRQLMLNRKRSVNCAPRPNALKTGAIAYPIPALPWWKYLWWGVLECFGISGKVRYLEKKMLPSKSEETESVFHWSGANLQSNRMQAAKLLYERLKVFEERKIPYHVIAHSHGGTILWEALQLAYRDRCYSWRSRWIRLKSFFFMESSPQDPTAPKVLPRLKSWTTVGTPYLFEGPDWIRLWLLVPLFLLGASLVPLFDDRPWYPVRSLWFNLPLIGEWIRDFVQHLFPFRSLDLAWWEAAKMLWVHLSVVLVPLLFLKVCWTIFAYTRSKLKRNLPQYVRVRDWLDCWSASIAFVVVSLLAGIGPLGPRLLKSCRLQPVADWFGRINFYLPSWNRIFPPWNAFRLPSWWRSDLDPEFWKTVFSLLGAEFTGLLLVILAVLLGMLWGLILVVNRGRGYLTASKMNAKAYVKFASRHLCLAYAERDEAICLLKAVAAGIQGEIVPRMPRPRVAELTAPEGRHLAVPEKEIDRQTFSGWVAEQLFLPVAFVKDWIIAPLYNDVFAKLVDAYIHRQLRGRAFGDDIAGTQVKYVSDHPLVDHPLRFRNCRRSKLSLNALKSLDSVTAPKAGFFLDNAFRELKSSAHGYFEVDFYLSRIMQGDNGPMDPFVHTHYFDSKAVRESIADFIATERQPTRYSGDIPPKFNRVETRGPAFNPRVEYAAWSFISWILQGAILAAIVSLPFLLIWGLSCTLLYPVSQQAQLEWAMSKSVPLSVSSERNSTYSNSTSLAFDRLSVWLAVSSILKNEFQADLFARDFNPELLSDIIADSSCLWDIARGETETDPRLKRLPQYVYGDKTLVYLEYSPCRESFLRNFELGVGNNVEAHLSTTLTREKCENKCSLLCKLKEEAARVVSLVKGKDGIQADVEGLKQMAVMVERMGTLGDQSVGQGNLDIIKEVRLVYLMSIFSSEYDGHVRLDNTLASLLNSIGKISSGNKNVTSSIASEIEGCMLLAHLAYLNGRAEVVLSFVRRAEWLLRDSQNMGVRDKAVKVYLEGMARLKALSRSSVSWVESPAECQVSVSNTLMLERCCGLRGSAPRLVLVLLFDPSFRESL